MVHDTYYYENKIGETQEWLTFEVIHNVHFQDVLMSHIRILYYVCKFTKTNICAQSVENKYTYIIPVLILAAF